MQLKNIIFNNFMALLMYTLFMRATIKNDSRLIKKFSLKEKFKMFASIFVLKLFLVLCVSTVEILEMPKAIMKTNKKRTPREYFPGIHQSINTSGVLFSYDDLTENGEK